MFQPIGSIFLSLHPKELAYLDPGSGSFLLQLLLASLLAAGIAVASFWKRIRSFLGLKSTAKKDDGEEEEEFTDQE